MYSRPLNINDLPLEILLFIFIKLELVDLINVSTVCSMWNNLSRDDACWKSIAKAHLKIEDHSANQLSNVYCSYKKSMLFFAKHKKRRIELLTQIDSARQNQIPLHPHSLHPFNMDYYDIGTCVNYTILFVSNWFYEKKCQRCQSQLEMIARDASNEEGSLENQLKHFK